MPKSQKTNWSSYFDQFLSADIHLLRKTVGLIIDNEIHVLLVPVNSNGEPNSWISQRNPTVLILINYFGSQVTVRVTPQALDGPLSLFSSGNLQLSSKGEPLSAVIKGLVPFSEGLIEEDVISLLASVLFDLEFKYGLSLETAEYENMHPHDNKRTRLYPDIPITPVGMIYKPYLSQLKKYFHAAQRAQSLRFKCICYLNVLEFFFSKGSNQFSSGLLKKLNITPDYRHRTDFYTREAKQAFKPSINSYITDTSRIKTVLSKTISPFDIYSILQRQMLIEHFTRDHLLKCDKPRVLPALEFMDEKLFYRSLTERIYCLMITIGSMYTEGSGETSDKYTTYLENQDIIRKETKLLKEIAMHVSYKIITTL